MAGFTLSFRGDRFQARLTNANAPGNGFATLDFPGADFPGSSDQWDNRYLTVDSVMVRVTTDANIQNRRPALRTQTDSAGMTAMRWLASTTVGASVDRRYMFSYTPAALGLVANAVIKEDLPFGLVVNSGSFLELELLTIQAGDVIQEMVVSGTVS